MALVPFGLRPPRTRPNRADRRRARTPFRVPDRNRGERLHRRGRTGRERAVASAHRRRAAGPGGDAECRNRVSQRTLPSNRRFTGRGAAPCAVVLPRQVGAVDAGSHGLSAPSRRDPALARLQGRHRRDRERHRADRRVRVRRRARRTRIARLRAAHPPGVGGPSARRGTRYRSRTGGGEVEPCALRLDELRTESVSGVDVSPGPHPRSKTPRQAPIEAEE